MVGYRQALECLPILFVANRYNRNKETTFFREKKMNDLWQKN